MLTGEKAIEILKDLIGVPGVAIKDIPQAWSECIQVYRAAFAPPVEIRSKRKRRGGTVHSQGWPLGLRRDVYRQWKDSMLATGAENISPQECRRLMDAGELNPSEKGSQA